jgi:hypothetical protein
MYGDAWLDTRYAAVVEAFNASALPALMCVFRNDNRWDTSNVLFENGVIRLYSKRQHSPEMSYIDWGLSMLKAAAIASRPTDEPWDLSQLYEGLSVAGRLGGYEVTQRFCEIGSFGGLDETNRMLSTFPTRSD